MKTKEFFDWIIERHKIYLKRCVGDPAPWSDDPIFQTTRFCNPFRENDKTTAWFREHVRDPLRNSDSVFMATVIFRWFNYIPTGEILLKHNLYENFDPVLAKQSLSNVKKLITGAYMIKSPDGMPKLDGIIHNILTVKNKEPEILDFLHTSPSLQKATLYMTQFPQLGKFLSYEIITDLRYTHFLENAPDIYTWANPGPGAKRGLNRVYERDIKFNQPDANFVSEMQYLLSVAHNYIPKLSKNMEMRDIEHSLCEFDKYERVKEGGHIKNHYNGNPSSHRKSKQSSLIQPKVL